MAANEDATRDFLKESLAKAGLISLYLRFSEENITFEIAQSLSDGQLSSLGVTTIGERHKLRQALTDEAKHQDPEPARNIRNIQLERSRLFAPGRTSVSSKAKKKKKPRTWTANFICLADRHQIKVPTSVEREILFKAGLGLKKIQLYEEDTEDDVMKKLTDERNFHQLKNIGGFELLRCKPNCRELGAVDCRWTVRDLRATLGSQAKIYLRPIQTSLSLKQIQPQQETTRMEKCKACEGEFPIQELRSHVRYCFLSNNFPDSDEEQYYELPDPLIGENVTYIFNDASVNHDQPSGTAIHGSESVIPNSSFEQTTDMEVHGNESAQISTANESDQISLHENAASVNQLSDNILSGESLILNSSVEHASNRSESELSVEGHDMQQISTIVGMVTNYCIEKNIVDPTDILKIFQKHIVTGRPLDLVSDAETIEGMTNLIMVDRQNILNTAVEEITSLEDLRPCLEVQFYGESAVDFGGPRKEFFALVLREIKDIYFNPVKEWTPSSYEVVGKILALSLLQNGKLPRVFSSDIVEEFTSPTARKFIMELRKGLDGLGLCQMMDYFPQMLIFFTHDDGQKFLTLKKVTTLLKAEFSVDGSNQRQTEGKIYSAFIKYLREVAGGRRGDISLSSILKFVTGSEEEPVLGFHIHPSIAFVKNASLVPTSNTCVNKLNLAIPSGSTEMPSLDILFNLYDYAFSNAYFGLQ